MQRKYINILLVVLMLAIIFIIAWDFTGNKAGKNIENPYQLDLDVYRKVDTTTVLFRESVTFPLTAEGPRGITVSGRNILVATAKFLLRYDPAGKELSRFNLPDTVSCLTCGADGTIWVALLHSVLAYSPSGTLLKQWKSFGDRSVITSLAVKSDQVFVADAGNRVVYQCNLNGEVLSRIGEKDEIKGTPGYVIPSPYFDVALDDGGFLWTANTGRHSLENYNPDGSLRTSWGKSSTRIDGFIGCCNPAHFAMMKDNTFITAEKGFPRIKWYDQHGVMKGVVAPPGAFEKGWYAPDVTVDANDRVIALDFDRDQVRIFEKK